jgi:hypothetical protein
MKTKYLFVLGCMFFILFKNEVVAQASKIMEKTVNGETYIINHRLVKNKKNKLPDGKQCYDFSIEDDSPLDSVFGAVLSKTKMHELVKSKASIMLDIVCIPSGKIETVSFILSKNNPVSLVEIQLLEERLKKTTLKIKSGEACQNNSYFAIMKMCRFERYAQTPQVK